MLTAWEAGGLYSQGFQTLCDAGPAAVPLWALQHLLPLLALCLWLMCVFKHFTGMRPACLELLCFSQGAVPFHRGRSSASGKPGAMLELNGPWRWEELHSRLEGCLGIEGTQALHTALASALSGFIFPLNREMARTTKELV